jgi:hypothetical protein
MATDVAETTMRVRMREVPGYPAFDPSWRLVDVDRGDILEVVAILPSIRRNDLTLACKRGGVQR